MQVGDIIFFKGTSWISRVIATLTGSPYTHVAIAMSHTEILEADRFIKVRIRPLGDREVYRVMRCKGLTSKQQSTLFSGGIAYEGAEYNYLGAFLWFLRLITNYKGQGLVSNANRVYCSELVDKLYAEAGIDLVPNRVDGDVLPEHLLQSPLLTQVYNT